MKFFIIALIISILVISFYIRPMWEKKIVLETELLNVSDVLSQKTVLAEKLNELVIKYNRAQKYEQNINLAIPNQPEEENLIAQLEAIGFQSGVIISKIGISKFTNQKNSQSAYKELGLDLAIKGSFFSIERFLELISKSMRIIEIDSLDLNPDVSGSLFTANIKGKAFYK